MREPASSLVLAHHNILVNGVKLIGVNFINVKIMELVLSLSLTTFQHQNANVMETMVEEFVTLTYARILNVVTEFVLGESVSVRRITLTMKMFVWTFVKVSIVEAADIVQVVFVAVK